MSRVSIKNMGAFDRFFRVLLAESLFILGYFWLFGFLQIAVYLFAVIFLITSMVGMCPLYALFHFDTRPKSDGRGWRILGPALGLLVLIVGGSEIYGSMFFSKKIFLEEYSSMNEYYKQTLFFTGQEKRQEAVENYDKLVTEYAVFRGKYEKYHPYVISRDVQFNNDVTKAADIIVGIKDVVNSGNLKFAHVALEQVRPIFQDILKRNGFSMLAISLVDFHDAMEVVIGAADAKDSNGVIAAYLDADTKLRAVEALANDAEIQAIRQNLDALLVLAKNASVDALSGKAAELKSSFVKVYLQRG